MKNINEGIIIDSSLADNEKLSNDGFTYVLGNNSVKNEKNFIFAEEQDIRQDILRELALRIRLTRKENKQIALMLFAEELIKEHKQNHISSFCRKDINDIFNGLYSIRNVNDITNEIINILFASNSIKNGTEKVYLKSWRDIPLFCYDGESYGIGVMKKNGYKRFFNAYNIEEEYSKDLDIKAKKKKVNVGKSDINADIPAELIFKLPDELKFNFSNGEFLLFDETEIKSSMPYKKQGVRNNSRFSGKFMDLILKKKIFLIN